MDRERREEQGAEVLEGARPAQEHTSRFGEQREARGEGGERPSPADPQCAVEESCGGREQNRVECRHHGRGAEDQRGHETEVHLARKWTPVEQRAESVECRTPAQAQRPVKEIEVVRDRLTEWRAPSVCEERHDAGDGGPEPRIAPEGRDPGSRSGAHGARLCQSRWRGEPSVFVAPARHGPAVFHSRFRLSWNTLGDSARRSALSRTQASSARRAAGRARPARDPRPARASRQRVSVNFRVSTWLPS